MGPTQGIQGYQAIQILNNDIYGSAGSNSSSSYVSASGIKSVLLHAWNTVKSAVSGMLSSFGLHLSGQQGSDKPERRISVDMHSRPAQPLPVDVQFENDIYESSGGNVYDSVSSPGQGSLSPSLSASESEHLYEEIGAGQIHTLPETPPPVNLSTHPSLSESLYSEIKEPLYAEIGEGQDQTPPPVNLSTHPSLSRLPGSGDGIYAEPRDSLKADGRAEQEGMDPEYASLHENIYSEPYKPGDTISTPENDPRGDSDYDTPWKSQPDQQLQQRRIRERLNTL